MQLLFVQLSAQHSESQKHICSNLAESVTVSHYMVYLSIFCVPSTDGHTNDRTSHQGSEADTALNIKGPALQSETCSNSFLWTHWSSYKIAHQAPTNHDICRVYDIWLGSLGQGSSCFFCTSPSSCCRAQQSHEHCGSLLDSSFSAPSPTLPGTCQSSTSHATQLEHRGWLHV